MSQIQILLVVWAGLTVIFIFIGLTVYYLRTKTLKTLELAEFINLALASAAIVSSCSLIYRAITSDELIKILQFDIVTLFLGAIAVIWLSLQQIWQIF